MLWTHVYAWALKTAKVALLCGIIQTHKHCFPFLGHGNAKWDGRSGLALSTAIIVLPKPWNHKKIAVDRFYGAKAIQRGKNVKWRRSLGWQQRALLHAAVEVLRFGLGSQISRKIHFPSLQTVVSVSVMEGLRIDLNYLGCLEKLSEEEADLKSCNKQHSSFHDNLLFSACLPAASTINTISASLSVSKV